MPDGVLQDIHFCGINFTTGDLSAVADYVTALPAFSGGTAPTLLVHINVHNLYHIHKKEPLQQQLNDHAKILFDGIGMKLGALLAGHPWLPDLNGTDLFHLVMSASTGKPLKVFLLGGKESIVEQAASCISSQYEQVSVVGHHHGHFSEAEETAIVEDINRRQPDILLVGMGCPIQEAFILRNRQTLGTSVIWAVGGLFDFVSGKTPRAPRWIRRIRLEWFYRFLLEPARMWQRVFVEAPWFFLHICQNELFVARQSPNGKIRVMNEQQS